MKKLFIKAAALALSLTVFVTGCGNSQAPDFSEETTVTVSDAGTSSAETENSSSAASSVETTTEAPEENAFAVRWELSGTWEQDGAFCGGYSVYITNNSGSPVDEWKAEFDVPEGFELTAQWNGKFNVENNKVTVDNEEYNGAIDDGGEVSFGFNYSSPEEFRPSGIKINGQKAKEDTGPAETSAATISETTAVSASDEVTTSDEITTSATVEETTTSTTAQTAPPTAGTEATASDPSGTTPVSQHGQLSLKGTHIVDKNGNNYQLKGMSTHGIGWFPDFVNEQSFKTLRDDWHTNTVRLAMYSGASEGYSGSNMAQHEAIVKKGIDIAIKLDMYVIVDWHILADQSPQVRKDDAKRFFEEISSTYGSYPNIVYEICNEPNGYATWEGDVKPYAEEIIPIIRKNDPDSLIIVGTPTWSQDIDKALANPLKYDNVLYALHFYAATHTDWLRQRLKQCVNSGLPVFVSEFGCCDASGNGNNDFNQTKQWLTLLDELGISYMNWALANKNETCCVLKGSAPSGGNWSESDLSEGGNWIRKWFRGEQ